MSGPASFFSARIVSEQTRIEIPGGGSFLAPAGYAFDDRFQKSLWRGGVTVFRKMRTVMGGYVECDGLINVCRRDVYPDLDAFCTAMDGSGTTRWEFGNLKPGWTSWEDEKFPVTHGDAERMQELHLTSAGWLRPRADQAWRVGFGGAAVWLQVWVMQRHGGLDAARRLAAELSASVQP